MASRRKKKRRRRGSPLRRLCRGLYTTLVILSALIVGMYLGYKALSQRPGTAEPPPDPNLPTITDDPATLDVDESQQGLQRKEATWTFLLAAEDQVSGSTDTIMVCTYDTKNQTIGLVSLPRDTVVDREGWKYYKLNSAYSNGNYYDPPNGGIDQLKAAAGEIVGFPIDHYVLIDTDIFVEIVNAVDGVDFNVPVYMCYDAPDQDLHIHYNPGMQHLTGKQALEVVRCRNNSDGPGEYPDNVYPAYPDLDIGRTRTQQEMIKTIAKKVLSNPQKAGSYIELFSRYVKTDLTLGNMLWFLEPALKFDFANLTTGTLPGRGDASYHGISVYELDIEGSLELINRCINPYTTDITVDMVRMVRGD